MFIHPVNIIIALLVVLAVVIGRSAYLRRRERKAPVPFGGANDDLLRLKERMRVLERIVVEKENSLAREIEDLRSK